jgi:hypothetical protein
VNKRWRVNTNCFAQWHLFHAVQLLLSLYPALDGSIGAMDYTKEGKTNELISTAGAGHTQVAARLYTKHHREKTVASLLLPTIQYTSHEQFLCLAVCGL